MSMLKQPRVQPCPAGGDHTLTHSGQHYCDRCRPASVTASNARSATSRQANAVHSTRLRPLPVNEWNRVRQRWRDVVDLANTVALDIEEFGQIEMVAEERSALGSASTLIEEIRRVDSKIGPVLRRDLRTVDR